VSLTEALYSPVAEPLGFFADAEFVDELESPESLDPLLSTDVSEVSFSLSPLVPALDFLLARSVL
jgi:hypothetical protein